VAERNKDLNIDPSCLMLTMFFVCLTKLFNWNEFAKNDPNNLART
jgi:hypothetical protein